MTTRPRARARVLLVAVVIGLAALLAAPASAADPTTPAGAPGSEQTPAPTIVPYPSVAESGTEITVRGENWPASIPIQVALCGNSALNGTGDCDGSGAGSTTTSATGTFGLTMTALTPPVPCPCVIFVNSFATEVTSSQPFTLLGAEQAPPTVDSTVRTADVALKMSGTNVSAWVGGSAKRNVAVTIKNTGTAPLTDPIVTVTAGSSPDPTTVVGQPKVGTIAPGASASADIPVTFAGPTFGTYYAKVTVTGLSEFTEATDTTTSYPWLLLVIAWLLLQPLLLGLYKRRPVVEDGIEDDPLWYPGGPSPSPVPSAAAASAFTADSAGFAPRPAGAVVAAGAAAAGLAATSPRAVVPAGYQAVFGVTDLRTYLDPAGNQQPQTVAPRIVLGGLGPAVQQAPVPPAQVDDPIAPNGAAPQPQ